MPRVSDSHKERRRQQIIDGARRAFARRGLQATTVRELEQEIGLSTGALFSYYPTKLDLFVAVAEQDAARAAQEWHSGGLRALLNAATDPARSPESVSFLEVGHLLQTDEAFRRRWAVRSRVLVDAIREGLEAGRADGSVRVDVRLDDLMVHTVAALDGLLLQARLGTSRADLEVPLRLYEESLRPNGR